MCPSPPGGSRLSTPSPVVKMEQRGGDLQPLAQPTTTTKLDGGDVQRGAVPCGAHLDRPTGPTQPTHQADMREERSLF